MDLLSLRDCFRIREKYQLIGIPERSFHGSSLSLIRVFKVIIRRDLERD